MKNKFWLIGPLLWDVIRYLSYYTNLDTHSIFSQLYNHPSLSCFAFTTKGLTHNVEKLLYEARSIAMGKELQPSPKKDIPLALKSVFSSVNIGTSSKQPVDYYFKPQQLSETPDLTEDTHIDINALKTHLEKFYNELQCLRKRNSIHKIETLLPLIEKYFWSLPSLDTARDTDVPLYALAKMSTAIMACWPEAGDGLPLLPSRDNTIYSLICGDISGIQKYIYRISSAKGVAKGLKARSMELAILTDAIAKSLLVEFDLSTVNLIYSNGGKFYILAPAAAKQRIDSREADSPNYQLQDWFWKTYRGELFLGLGAVYLSGNDFISDKFSAKWLEATQQCEIPKRAKFNLLIQNDYKKFFAPKGTGGDTRICSICHQEGHLNKSFITDKNNALEERSICATCERTENLGSRLSTANLIVEVINNRTNALPHFPVLRLPQFDIAYYVLKNSEEFIFKGDHITYFNLNLPDHLNEKFLLNELDKTNVDCSFYFYGGNRVPVSQPGGEPCNYDKLSESSRGIKRLGFLRMDVDFLGKIFSQGLHPCNTAARLLTLSWHLNYYFCARLNQLCYQTTPKQALIIYSGGDDLFILGSWDKVLELSQTIREDFTNYTKNPQLTISGGIVIVPKKFPIHKAAILSGQAEEAAKEIDGILRRQALKTDDVSRKSQSPFPLSQTESLKNGFTFLAKPLRWHDFDIVVAIKQALLQAIMLPNPQQSLNKGILSRLRQIHNLYEIEYRESKRLKYNSDIDIIQYNERLKYNKWRWRMVYALTRYKEDHHLHKPLIDNLQAALLENKWKPIVWVDNQWCYQKTAAIHSSPEVLIVSIIDLPVRWVELLTREEKSYASRRCLLPGFRSEYRRRRKD